MRLTDIKHLICLPCVLFIFNENSQTSLLQPLNCTTGWFGPTCNYRCRCAKDNCDANGLCTGAYTCQAGWFGPACQYADLAYMSGSVAQLTDGNDSTCLHDVDTDNVTITLQSLIVFSWLRVRVNQTDKLGLLSVTLTSNKQPIDCLDPRTSEVEDNTLDMYCELTQSVNEVVLAGVAVRHLCSVYVSGGRNVALKEKVVQPSTYFETTQHTQYVNVSFPADKAVDGNTHQRFYEGFPCSRTASNGTWSLVLSRSRSVTRYVIYNRQDNFANGLIGFRLESFDTWNNSVFLHEDNNSQAQSVYTVTHAPISVKLVHILSRSSWGIITLCEVEIYGDSICGSAKYGRECEHTCKCPVNEDCLVSTGGCPSDCLAGFYGSGCFRKCPPNTYGPTCSRNCSEFCVKNKTSTLICKTSNGHCLHGCVDGYIGKTCTTKCRRGTFGKDCKSSCTEACVSSNSINMPVCDYKNGACLQGCEDGYSGLFCEETSSMFTGADIGLVIGLLLVISAGLASLYYLSIKRQDPSADEQT